MNLNDLLLAERMDPRNVLVFRHRPHEPELNKVLPWLVAEKPDLFNAYQQTQPQRLERAMEVMKGTGYVASFIGREPGKALYVGLYSIGKSKPLSYRKYWAVPAHVHLREAFGVRGFTRETRSLILWFDLVLTDFYARWKGRLVVGWPGKERSWWRRAHRNDFPILAIHEDSALVAKMPEWDEIDFTWDQLKVLPTALKLTLRQWRGIYYNFDTSDGKGYVGAAYGKDNLFGRWLHHAGRRHGNRLLRQRDPCNFRFTVLQIVAHDAPPDDVIRLEASWKERLHTRAPYGLNEN